MDCIIYSDGGARGNPGPAAAGGVILARDGSIIGRVSEYLGVATNNVAEYRALIVALKRALDAGCRRVEVRLDSELVVKQLSGLYRVKDAKMQTLYQHVRRLLDQFEAATVKHVPRSENRDADRLVNDALDARAARAQAEAPKEEPLHENGP